MLNRTRIRNRLITIRKDARYLTRTKSKNISNKVFDTIDDEELLDLLEIIERVQYKTISNMMAIDEPVITVKGLGRFINIEYENKRIYEKTKSKKCSSGSNDNA